MRLSPHLAGLAALAALAGIVEAIVAAKLVSPLVVARPSDTVLAIGRLIAEEDLLAALGATILTTLITVALAVALGVPAGYLLYRYTSFGLAYRNWLAALFAAPLVLLYPLVLVLFGRTYAAVGFMGLLVGLVPIVLGTCDGLAQVPRTLRRVGQALRLSPAAEFRKILLPAGAPMIFTGIRLGIIYALVNVIGIEFLINFGGLGFTVSEMYDRLDIPGMYAAILFVVLVSGFMLWLTGRVQRWLRPA